MAAFELPSIEKLQTIIGGLVMGGVTAEPCDPSEISDRTVKAIYETDSCQSAALCCCDIPLSNFLGASLSMIPAGQANEYANSGALPENIKDNLTEVLNVAANLFITPESKRLKLKEVLGPGDSFDEVLAGMIKSPAAQSCVTVNVCRYGSGRMSFLLTK